MGSSSKLKLPKVIVDKFFSTIQKIDAAVSIHDLWRDPSLNFEKYKKYYSMRLSGKYRLEMEIEWINEEKTIGKFFLIRISNHYGD